MNLLGPKEVAGQLGISERTAARLMSSGEIESMRAGQKLLRTTQAHLNDYRVAQFAMATEGPHTRALMQSVACLRELEGLEVLSPEQAETLRSLEIALSERQSRNIRLVA